MTSALDQLLVTLEVRLEAFALLEVQRGYRLVSDGFDQVIVHYVLSGTGWLESGDGELTRCSEGSVIVVPSGVPQAFRVGQEDVVDVDAGAHCAMVKEGLIRFDAAPDGPPDLEVLCGSLTATQAGSFGLFEGLQHPLIEHFDGARTVPPAFAMLRGEIASPSFGTRALASSIMKLCLILLIRKHLTELAHASPLVAALKDPRLSRAVASVVEAPADAHTVASLAATAGMSRSAFSKLFGGSFAETPMEFVAKTRLHHAAELLRGTDLPVKVIAASIGFSSRSHFSRAFRAAYGQDPRGYRRLHLTPATAVPAKLPGSRIDYALSAEPR